MPPCEMSAGRRHPREAPRAASTSQTWEAEIDTLMRRQLTTRDIRLRKRPYDRVQGRVAQNLRIIALLSRHGLVGATKRRGNVGPTMFDHHALWSVEELFRRGGLPGARR